MKRHKKALAVIGSAVVLGLVAILIVASRSGEVSARMGVGGVIPQPDVTVRAYPSYASDIQPIFSQYCVSCHGSTNAPNGLRLDSYAGAIKGTRFGAVITAGKPDMSPIVALLRHESDPKIWMPYHKEQLSENRIKNIENWVRYGARNN